ncbi:hypothetical protein [Deinococcus ruber]|uniref:Uncharacterized protein n=1 Tax=Deinococcus ruber TaxID=1848197 RepID=A0A918BYA2_9DEIO|nr:hypothetical protein [Deinococcus ruber]GGQ96489.1 hypothetical protein GCM10008957_05930 [Deinococcus ruber]
MKQTQNVRSRNSAIKPFAAVLVLSASTAFAASGTTTAAPSTAPLAQTTPRAGQAAPTVPGQATPGQPGEGNAVCAPDPMKGQPGQPGKNAGAGNTAAPTGTPAPLKNAARPAPGQNDPAALNCMPPRPPRQGGHGQMPGGQMQPGQMPGGQQMQPGQMPGGPGGRDGAGPDGQGQPNAARLQDDLTRLDALLAQTTDPKAKSYLTDARMLLKSGDPSKIRAAHDLIHAAAALSAPAAPKN